MTLLLLWILAFCFHCTQAQVGEHFNSTVLPDTSKYKNTRTFALTKGGTFSIYWKIDNKATVLETFEFLLMLNGFPPQPSNEALKNAWMSIGFGQSMRQAEFIVCHLKGNSVELHEHLSQPGYAPPIKHAQKFLVQGLSGGYLNGTMFIQGARLTKGQSHDHVDLVVDGFQPILWAFNPQSAQISDGTYFSYHGPNGPINEPFSQTHGLVSMNLVSGQVNDLPLISYKMLQMHGLGMSLMYLVAIPLGLFIARYLKSWPFWVHGHAAVQGTAVIGIAIFFGIVLMTYQQYSGNHARLGISIIILTALQVIMGGSNRVAMMRYDVNSFHWMRYLHRFNGYAILTLAVAQVYLGLTILYPNSETRGQQYWHIYAAVVVFWVLLFGCTEIYYYVTFRKVVKSCREEKDALIQTEESNEKRPRLPFERWTTLMTLQSDNTGSQEKFKKYTWKDLSEEVQRTGKILVVANGKYVYDASQWIHSHPGGKVILYSVAGTDITMDYFRESGYDASQFVPQLDPPERHHPSTRLPRVMNDNLSVYSDPISFASNESILVSLQNASYMSQEDWRIVEKTRRTHVHTRMALERLSKILVGEMDMNSRYLSSHTLLASNPDGLEFDPYEYRRYAITEKVLLTNDGKSRNHIYKFKFTCLYPYDLRHGQPHAFTQGECVEIQVRLPTGIIASRYYTPIHGNLTAFEVMIKMTGGLLTSYLENQRCGDRQVKIRGPFGGSLFNPPFNSSFALPQHIVFITAGSGITPLLQFLTTSVLPVNEALKVENDFTPQSSDEMTLLRGQFVAAQNHYYDGWAYGTNLVTGEEGVFPLSLVTPAAGRHYKITVINCTSTTSDIVGREILDATMLAYPSQMDVHHIVNDLSEGIRDGITGYLHEGRLDARLMNQLLQHIQHGKDPYYRSAVVCGPGRFIVDIVDILKDQMGWLHDQVRVLSDSSYT